MDEAMITSSLAAVHMGSDQDGAVNSHIPVLELTERSTKVLHNGNSLKPPPERIEYNLRDCVASFTGREGVIQELHQSIQKNRDSGDLTILGQTGKFTGVGGIGKSETMRKYIQDYKGNYSHILWINAENYSVARDCFYNIAGLTNVISNHKGRIPKKDEEIFAEVYNFVCKKPTMIVFDNADSLLNNEGEDGIAAFLPRSILSNRKKPDVIVIARSPQCKTNNVITLTGFTDTEIYKLLLDQLEFPDNEENRKLAAQVTNLCDGLPLVIQLVIGMIKTKAKGCAINGDEDQYSMQAFLKDYHGGEEGHKHKTSEEIPADLQISGKVYKIIMLAFENLAKYQYGLLALHCLNIAALLRPDGIPADLLVSLVHYDIKDDVRDALDLLVYFNLLNISKNSFSISRILQKTRLEILRNELVSDISDLTYRNGLEEIMLRTSFTFMNYLQEAIMLLSPDSKSDIFDNGMHLSNRLIAEKYEDTTVGFQINLSVQLGANQKYVNAIKICKRVMDIDTKRNDYFNAYEDKRHLAAFYLHHGNFKEAEEIFTTLIAWVADWDEKLASRDQSQESYSETEEAMYLNVLQTKTTHLGNGHYEDLIVKHNLALTFKYQKQFDVAEKLLKEVIEKQETALGKEHSNTLMAKNDLASTYMSLGKFEEAEDIYKTIVGSFETNFGSDHSNVLITKNNLATLYNHRGKFNEAEELFKNILMTQKPVLGKDHPIISMTKRNLGLIYVSLGKFDEYCKIALDSDETVVGDVYLDTLNSKHILALNFVKQQIDEAAGLSEDVLEKREMVFGSNNTDNWETQNSLAFYFQPQENLDEAEDLYIEPRERHVSVLGNDHADTLAKYDLASFYMRLKKYDIAEGLFKEVTEKRETGLGKNHPDTWLAKSNLITAYMMQRKYTQAEELLVDILAGRGFILKNGSVTTLNLQNRMVMCYELQRKFAEAEECFKEISTTRERVLSSNQPDILETMNYANIEELRKDAIETYERMYGQHPSIIWTYKINLALYYTKQEKHAEAEKLYKDMVKRHEEVLGKEHPQTFHRKYELAANYLIQSKPGDAEKLSEDVLAGYEVILGLNHERTLKAKYLLAVIYHKQDKFAKAEGCFKELLKQQEAVLGSDHKDTWTTRSNLATNYMVQKQHADAEPLLKEILEKKEATLGKDHPDTLVAKHNLASSCSRPEKLQMYKEVIQQREKVLGSSHPKTVSTKHNLATAYMNQEKFDEAAVLLREILKQQEIDPGKNDPVTLMNKFNLAFIYLRQGKYGKAEKFYADILARRKVVLGTHHPETLSAEKKLAYACERQSKFGKAEELHKDILAKIGSGHPDALKTKDNLVANYMFQKKYGEAEVLTKEILKQQEATLDKDHPEVLTIKTNLASIYGHQKRSSASEGLIKEVFVKRKAILGPDHPDTLQAKHDLGIIYRVQGKFCKSQALFRDN